MEVVNHSNFKSLSLQILNEPSVFEKLRLIKQSTQSDLIQTKDLKLSSDYLPGRDIEILHPKYHPKKPGFSTKAGQARMLHDLANIELQAMELGLRTLTELNENTPDEFKEHLLNITLSESEHLEMCLHEIDKLGHQWGDWPIHLSLWRTTSPQDSLLDRILIVHRYLEGSGLDAGDTLFRRLMLLDCPTVKAAVHKITTDEVGHVLFGSDWYRKICSLEKIDPEKDYSIRMNNLLNILPKRLEPLSLHLRKQAGFDENEIQYLQKLRLNQMGNNIS